MKINLILKLKKIFMIFNIPKFQKILKKILSMILIILNHLLENY